MEFPFPPEPPDYAIVVISRGILVVWSLVGLTILVMRLRRWKFIQSREIGLWMLAGFASLVVAGYGDCKFTQWDNNDWNVPAYVGALSISIAGVCMGLCKLYGEGLYGEMRPWLCGIFVIFCVTFFVCLPTLSHPREASSRTQCKNNLKQISLAMHNYHDQYYHFPPSGSRDVPISWRVELLPWLDQSPLLAQYDRTKPWDSPPNDKYALQQIPPYTCPSIYYPGSAQDAKGRHFTAYSMPVGSHTVGANPLGTSIKQITDGTSNTFLVVEACGAQIVWTEPRDVDVDTQPTGINLKGTKPGNSKGWLASYHLRAVHVAMADGSVRWVSGSTDRKILKKLVTIDGGEDLSNVDW